MTKSATYSLWLEPSGDIAYRLQERIKELSKKYETPVFSPHVTLLGSIKSTETELIPITNTLASSQAPFELVLTRAGYRDTFYQSLFVHVNESNHLKELRKMACRLYDSDEDKYMPHLSLLYGDLTQKEKERILNIMGREFHIRFPVNGIVVMKTDGLPGKWKKVHTAVFKEN